jgi:ribose 5-phosphate isomerase
MAIVKPFVAGRKFTGVAGSGTGTGATFSIAATTFTNDTGAAATAFPASFAYYNLYINAVIQTADTSSVTTTAITIPGGDVLDPATPIVVEFVVT